VSCFDEQGAILGGGSDYPELLPANGQVKMTARLLVSGTPDHSEMTAQPSDLIGRVRRPPLISRDDVLGRLADSSLSGLPRNASPGTPARRAERDAQGLQGAYRRSLRHKLFEPRPPAFA
jgi:hypothetical protein